jgi:hypothetical protein
MDPNTELASGFTVSQYLKLRPKLTSSLPDVDAWRELISAVRRRIDERFLEPIRQLARFDDRDDLPFRPGFAILALDCLLIDAIQSFREGRVSTGEVSPAHSFKTFLRSLRFEEFSGKDRSDFFDHVRNAILHNGETRGDWKIRIDTDRMLERNSTTGTRIINRHYFHSAVEEEWAGFVALLESEDSAARATCLRRMDAIAGIRAGTLSIYFAYGSNLKDVECRRTACEAEACGIAFLPGYRLTFNKHSITRGGDAANIERDASSVVWGCVYRVHGDDREALRKREGGYVEIPKITVYRISAEPKENPTPLSAFSFAAVDTCQLHCGPSADYLALILEGIDERHLPGDYGRTLAARLGGCSHRNTGDG